ncbi:MAG: efflux RND transporter permease subunit [Bacteroidales bacterium]|nr:efflux RND transporter permease subunit [Bacteroidales bacterium]
MKKIIQFATSNPVTIFMVVLAILLLGKISYDKLSVDLLPDLNNPRLFVEIHAGERPPEEMEKQFVKNLESTAIRQRDVTMVSSVIKAGVAQITVEYTWTKDMDEAFLDLQKAMNSYASNEDITELSITQNDPNTDPIILIGLSHNKIADMAELRRVAESYIRNELTRVEGIADVTLSGAEVVDLVVQTDPYKLNAFGLQLSTIASKIQDNNQRISGGRVTEMGMQYIVSGVNTLTTEEDFQNIIVGYKSTQASTTSNSSSSASTPNNMAPIFLREVATVHFENQRPENIVRINGKRSIGLSIYKEMRYNTVSAVDGVIKKLETIKKALPGYQFSVISNQGIFINSAIGEVKDSALMGILLSVFVIFMFLRRFGTTLIVSLAIPISIVATFNLMFFNDLSLNIMTLGGLALGAGMLVDNAVVVIESIFRNQERGVSVREAVVQGTSEVTGAVTASTLTTIVVFLPIVYLHGASGQLFKDMAWTITFSLVSSLFVAVLVIPTLYDQVFGGKHEAKAQKQIEVKSIHFKGYGRFVKQMLNHRWKVIGFSTILVGASFGLLPFIGTEFMPKTESNTFSVEVKMVEGTHLERTASAVENLEKVIYSITGDSLCSVYSHVGPGASNSGSIFEGENTATMKVSLDKNAPITQEQLIEKMFNYTQNVEGMELTFLQDENSIGALMGSEGMPVVIEVKGEELDVLGDLTAQVKARADSIPGLFNVISSVENGAPEIIITVNRTLAGMNSINVSTIVSQIQQKLEGTTAGAMDYRGEMRDIVIKTPDITLSELRDMTITSGEKEFRLAELAELTQTTAPKEIYRRNQNRINRITANLDEGVSLDKVTKKIEAAVSDINLPANYSITVTGEEEKRKESMNALLFALILSIVLVYMVMASQFESLLHPFTILLTIPMAIVGAILLFFITNTTINIMGFIGIVMLGGIAVNNAIILVDRIGQLKQSGMELVDAIAEAGQQRIRPIMMTSLSTILAMVPMSLGFGEGASLRSPMAIAVIGGMVTSTILSLIVIPCVYDVMERTKMSIQRRKKTNR